VLNFLFLAVEKVHNIDVWNAFFSKADKDTFRAYIHCKTPECLQSIAGSVLVPIPMVASYYCADLVTPMNALLSEALVKSPGQHPADKFVFVSESSLPAKPFLHIYNTLTARSGSDFCVCSVKEWATRRAPSLPGTQEGVPIEMAVKHHQWSVLERSHADKIVSLWRAGPSLVHDFLMRFQMNLPPRSRSVKTFGGSSDTGCLDEFYHMAAIFGTIPYSVSPNGTQVSMPGLTNAPLRVAAETDIQGSCDTFVAWPEYAKALDGTSNATGGKQGNSFTRLYASLDPLSMPYSGDARKPGYWDAISSHGIRAIRASDFLFVRKFSDHPSMTDGGSFGHMYTQIVVQ
jgi:hypothetical protein